MDKNRAFTTFLYHTIWCAGDRAAAEQHFIESSGGASGIAEGQYTAASFLDAMLDGETRAEAQRIGERMRNVAIREIGDRLKESSGSETTLTKGSISERVQFNNDETDNTMPTGMSKRLFPDEATELGETLMLKLQLSAEVQVECAFKLVKEDVTAVIGAAFMDQTKAMCIRCGSYMIVSLRIADCPDVTIIARMYDQRHNNSG